MTGGEENSILKQRKMRKTSNMKHLSLPQSGIIKDYV